MNKYIRILSKSEEFARLIFDEQWQGADEVSVTVVLAQTQPLNYLPIKDEEILERERKAQIEKEHQEAEERALAAQREQERQEREERERMEQEERERVERERKERTVARGGVRGVRGTRASMRGTRGTTRTGIADPLSRVIAENLALLIAPSGTATGRANSGQISSSGIPSKLPTVTGGVRSTSTRGLSKRT